MPDVAQAAQHAVEAVKWTEVVGAGVGVVGCVLTVIGAFVAYRSYQQRTLEVASTNKLDRYKNYLEIKRFYGECPGINSVRRARDIKDWSGVDIGLKYSFMSFYEEVALMVQSDLLSEDVAFYYYGVELLATYASEEFWKNAEFLRTDKFWELFRKFHDRMLSYNKKYGDREFPVESYGF